MIVEFPKVISLKGEGLQSKASWKGQAPGKAALDPQDGRSGANETFAAARHSFLPPEEALIRRP